MAKGMCYALQGSHNENEASSTRGVNFRIEILLSTVETANLLPNNPSQGTTFVEEANLPPAENERYCNPLSLYCSNAGICLLGASYTRKRYTYFKDCLPRRIL